MNPTRYRGPRRIRARATLAVESATARAYARTSTTSGSFRSPDSPTNSAGIERSAKASCSAGNSRLARHSTATDDHVSPARCRSMIRSAIHAASAHSSEQRITVTSPSPFAGHGRSSLSGSGRWFTGTGPMMVSAAARIRAPERKFVYRGSFRAGDPSARGNCFGKFSRLNSDAPRHA